LSARKHHVFNITFPAISSHFSNLYNGTYSTLHLTLNASGYTFAKASLTIGAPRHLSELECSITN